MAFLKDPYSVLVEAAAADLSLSTEASITESQIRSHLNSIEEVSQDFVITAEMVTVLQIGEDYLVEMNSIASYMKDNDIKTVSEALDNIAYANGLPEKSVGLLTESDDEVEGMIDKAKAKGRDAKSKMMDKIKKSTDITKKLKDKGYKVKKKKKKK